MNIVNKFLYRLLLFISLELWFYIVCEEMNWVSSQQGFAKDTDCLPTLLRAVLITKAIV